ncbi:MAG: endolytic transglycosylase MltG [Elusimicrobiota bacterium]
MKKIILTIIALFLITILIYFFMPRESVKVFIPEGANANSIAKILRSNGVVISSFYFKALVKLTKTDKRINPGEYVFMKYSPAEIVLYRMLNQKYLNSIKIVIPEGWRAEQVSERLFKNGVIKSEKRFIDMVKQRKLEGYLFPSTYFFNKNMSEEEVINLFLSTFDKNIRPLFSKYQLSKEEEYKTLIIASIVEREAVYDEERPLIAAVYLNRLKKKMPLEADPTVQYALGYWKKNLTHDDLQTPSPYNTYYVSGLPPTPICSPGVKSVEAVLNPAQIDAIYFVADNTGKHTFNVKYDEHIKAKEKARRERLIGNKNK